MSPAENIRKMVKQLHVGAGEQLDERVHKTIDAALTEPKDKQTADRQPKVWRLVMNNKMVKLAAAAVVVIAATIGISTLISQPSGFDPGAELAGPATWKLPDGSSVTLAADAKIRLYDSADKRGFEHLAGQIVVDVEKGNGEFVVATPHGNATALGTVFEMDLIDEVTVDTREKIEMLSLKVTEGTVEVSNGQGKVLVPENQQATMAKGSAPYSASSDDTIPARAGERIAAMVKAFEKGDAAAWAANFNVQAVFDLAQGKIADPAAHPWFSQMDAGDVQNLKNGLAKFADIDQVRKMFLGTINISGPGEVLIRSTKINEAGNIVEAVCVVTRDNGKVQIHPKWTNFDGDWWQTDD